MQQSESVRRAIEELGTELGPAMMEGMLAIFNEEQNAMAEKYPAIATDLAYGEHDRHRLDIYGPHSLIASDSEKPTAGLPVLIFAHGGGFLKGDKGDESRWYNACVGRMAAERNMLGVVINYRLAPEFTWPSGGEDLAKVVTWLKENVADWGGNPEKLFLIGTSAGANHVATYNQLYPQQQEVRGLLFLSGLYGVTPLDDRDTHYYGEPALYPNRMALPSLVSCPLPLFIACSEHDPQRFQQEWMGLVQQRLTVQHKQDRTLVLSGHNHYSIAGHLGTSDTRLADEIMTYINARLT
ncbi:alpha/beta hydrolase [uncultured Alteromonas sp.]|jgi:acetyl esterase/lipase|uniref:alpha/beta hydrolase n=1 Tax=uncultured Alteromonas sp. TaxID=179113 RepID=UPI0025E6D2E0|nr:alpha/beta hydrolase [uncultured Alteromonas sp.]